MPDVALCCKVDCLCVSCCYNFCSLVPIKGPPPAFHPRHSRQKPPTDFEWIQAWVLSLCVCPCWCFALPFVWGAALFIDAVFWFFYFLTCCCWCTQHKAAGCHKPMIRYHSSNQVGGCCHSTHNTFGAWEPMKLSDCGCGQAMSLRQPCFGFPGTYSEVRGGARVAGCCCHGALVNLAIVAGSSSSSGTGEWC